MVRTCVTKQKEVCVLIARPEFRILVRLGLDISCVSITVCLNIKEKFLGLGPKLALVFFDLYFFAVCR